MNEPLFPKHNRRQLLLPFLLVSCLFLLWGIANNMTDTLLSAFKRIMSMSDTQTSLIQFAFYGAYFCFAIPASLFIRRYSYKSGILLGLALYASGAILFFPAARTASYLFYLVAIYIMAGGCSVLETTANPYILSMGAPQTAVRRLNVAQSFNPIGSIGGILLSQQFILSKLNGADAVQRESMSSVQLQAIQSHELNAVTGTYMVLGFILLVLLVAMIFIPMPKGGDIQPLTSFRTTFSRLFRQRNYRRGVIAQFFYVGAQIGVWSFTIRIVMNDLSLSEQSAATIYLLSIVAFSLFRFFFTWIMRFVQPRKLLVFAAVAAFLCAVATVFSSGMLMVGFLIGISAFMSLMFPTIYGLALSNVGSDTKIGASGLIMAILGGAILTPFQGWVSDLFGIHVSYLVPAFCFLVVLFYAATAARSTSNQ